MLICVGLTIDFYFFDFVAPRRLVFTLHSLQVHTRTHAPAIAGYYYYYSFRFFEVWIAQTAALNSHTPTRKIPITKRHEAEDSSSSIQCVVYMYTPAVVTPAVAAATRPLYRNLRITLLLFLASLTLFLAGWSTVTRPSLPLSLISRIQGIDKNYDQIVRLPHQVQMEMHARNAYTYTNRINCLYATPRWRAHARTYQNFSVQKSNCCCWSRRLARFRFLRRPETKLKMLIHKFIEIWFDFLFKWCFVVVIYLIYVIFVSRVSFFYFSLVSPPIAWTWVCSPPSVQ